MNVPALIFHDSFFQYSPTIIGDEAARLGKLVDPKINLSPIVCITKETLVEIAQFNKLDRLFSQYLSSASPNIKQELRHSFLRQSIPDHIADQLLDWYHRVIRNEYVNIFASHTQGLQCHIHRSHVVGDTNMLESILEVWWESLEPIIHQHAPLKTFLQYAPTAICLQREPRAVASGIAYSVHPNTGSKYILVVESVHGVYQPHLSSVADTLEVHVLDSTVETYQIQEQTEIYIQDYDELKSVGLPRNLVGKPSISIKQAQIIANITQHVKKKFLDHIILHWTLTQTGIEVTGVEPYFFDHKKLTRQTKTNIFTTIGNVHKVGEYSDVELDGALFKSEYMFMSQGMHPRFILKSSQHTQQLERLFQSTLETTRHFLKNKPLVYRPLQLDSFTLRSLSYSELYEPHEENPFLGFNGALRAIHMPEVFSFELHQLQKHALRHSASISLLLPPTRSPAELKQLVSLVQASGLLSHAHVSLWASITTPAQLIDLEMYIIPEVAGYCVDIENLGALLVGYDPENKEVAGHYNILSSRVQDYIFDRVDMVKKDAEKQMYIYISTFSRQYVELALQHSYTGIIVKSKNIPYAKESVIEFEKVS